MLETAPAAAFVEARNQAERMPAINLDSNNDELSMYTQCCTDTSFAHTLYSYSSAVSFIKNRHTIKVGFEQIPEQQHRHQVERGADRQRPKPLAELGGCFPG